MARPEKYHWHLVDRLIRSGMPPGEISKKTAIPRATVYSRVEKLQSEGMVVENNPADADNPPQIPHPQQLVRPVSPPPADPDHHFHVPNTPGELAALAEYNQALQWLERLDKTEKNNAMLANALQVRIGRYLEQNKDMRACDIANIASAMATLESLGQSRDDLGSAIQTFMKFEIFDKQTAAYLAQAIAGDQGVALTKLRRIVRGKFD